MQNFADAIEIAEGFVRDKELLFLIGASLLSAFSFVLAVWSLLRRRGIRRLTRRIELVERRLRAAEIVEERRSIEDLKAAAPDLSSS